MASFLTRGNRDADEWGQIELLCGWPEQRDYKLIRPLVLFDRPSEGRAGTLNLWCGAW